MKVVIFCGGFGVRMGEETRRIPKPMIEIGGKPILWHIMRYYAMWGHDEFILCLGYKGEVDQEVLPRRTTGRCSTTSCSTASANGTKLELLSRDLDEWRITFVDTGINSTIGERLKAVEPYLGDDETFLATYGDGLTDAPLPDAHRDLPREPEDGDVPLGAPAVQRPSRLDRRGRQRPPGRGHEPLRPPHQRRLLRPQAGDHRPDRARATSSSRRRSRA